MPKKTKTYEQVIFTPEVIQQAEKTLFATLQKNNRTLSYESLTLSTGTEQWQYDTDDEFYSDYRKGFTRACFERTYGLNPSAGMTVMVYNGETEISVKAYDRAYVEKVFNVFEASVESCRLPEQPSDENKGRRTEWVKETINKIKTYFPNTARKLNMALQKLDSNEREEWQSSAMLIRDAWIELSEQLCNRYAIDTSKLEKDKVVERLEALNLKKNDEKVYFLAKDSFNLSMKHHSREINIQEAVASVISSVVSMQLVIQEVAQSKAK